MPATLHKARAHLCDLQGHLRAVGILVSYPQIKSTSSQVYSLLFALETPREWGLSSRVGGKAASELPLDSDLLNPSPVLCAVGMAKKCRHFPHITRSPRGYTGMVGVCLKGAHEKLLWVSKPPGAGHRWRICRQPAGRLVPVPQDPLLWPPQVMLQLQMFLQRSLCTKPIA